MTTSLSQLPAVNNPSIGFRLWTGLDEVPGMAAANNRLRIHTGVLEPIDIEGMTHRYTHLVNSDPLEDCVVATRSNGRTVGYGRVEWHDLVDGDRIYDHTVPRRAIAWGLGVARGPTHWCERRSREIASGEPDDRRTWMSPVRVRRRQELEGAPGRTAIVAVRWDAEMLRPSLEQIPGPPLADGYEIRTPDRRRSCRLCSAMTPRAFAEHWGQSEAGEQRLDEWIEEPVVPPRPGGHRLEGRRPVAMGQRASSRPNPTGPLSGLLDRRCTHPAHRRLGLARACHRQRACGACATQGPRAPTSAWTPTTRTGPTRSTSRAGSVSRPAAPATASPSAPEAT